MIDRSIKLYALFYSFFLLLFISFLFLRVQSAGSLERPASHNEEVKISVKERTQRFNKMASQVDLLSTKGNGAASVVGGAGANAERRDSKSKVVAL